MTAFFHQFARLAESVIAGCCAELAAAFCPRAAVTTAPRNRDSVQAAMLLVQCIAVLLVVCPLLVDSATVGRRKPITSRRIWDQLSRLNVRERSLLPIPPRRLRRTLLHAAKIHPELRVVVQPPDLYWDHSPRPVLLEKPVRRLQKKTFPSPHHLRNRGFHSRRSIKVH